MRRCLNCGTLAHKTRCPACTRSSSSKGYDRQWRNLARTYYGQPCHYCGTPADTVDHLIPKSQGGTDDPTNLVPACRPCNSAKRDR